MIEFLLQEYASRWERVLDASNKFMQLAGAPIGRQHLQPTDFLFLARVASDLQYICSAIQPETANVLLVEFEHIINHQPCSYQTVNALLESVINAIRRDTGEIRFAFIPKEKVAFFDKGQDEPFSGDIPLFGLNVHQNFPLATDDIRNAGNCLALDLHDAAAFHLLRVVETGLRELARDLKVPFPKTPLDYVGWDGVVKAINTKLEAKIPTIRGPKKSAALKFKHDMLVDFKAFEAPRNELLHGRLTYNKEQAIGLFNRVRDFMQRLDTQISPSPAEKKAKLEKRVNTIFKRLEKEKQNEI